VVSCSSSWGNFLSQIKTQIVGSNLNSIFNYENHKHLFHELKSQQPKSGIIFLNTQLPKAKNENKNFASNNAVLVLYAYIEKIDNTYSITMINWLNWLHNMTKSLERSYSFMKKFNDTISRDKFLSISDAMCYKAFFPLIAHIPVNKAQAISQCSLYEIMRLFIKQRDPNALFSRDYARNAYSRIRTNLRKDYNLEYFDPIDLIRDKTKLNINQNGNLCIPDTILENNLFLEIEHDTFLISLLNSAKSE
ncbi:MAG: hypothetical protein ORN24_00690, partial [Burkholderiales bacterium]|nr:hypothetical protein [Burkholderiales bacterium]